MERDIFGQTILNEVDIMDIYMSNPQHRAKYFLSKNDIVFDDILNLSFVPKIKKYEQNCQSIETFDNDLQSQWFIPEEYKNFDIAKFVLDQCKNEAELQRAGKELILFQEKNMFELLVYLKYLVDTFRKNNIVWGVGRGSSVASFVLFLIGVHRINSLHYDLDISEFLK